MAYTSYSEINTLEEISFIAGTTYYIDFKIYGSAGIPIPMSGKTIEWMLAPYGDKDYPSVIKTETPFDVDGITYGGGVTNEDMYTKRITLNPEDTENLFGSFVQQVTVIQQNDDTTTTTYKPAQGIVKIISDIKKPQ